MGKPQMVCRPALGWKSIWEKYFANITQILSKVSDTSIQESLKVQGKLSCMVLCSSCAPKQLEKNPTLTVCWLLVNTWWHQNLWLWSEQENIEGRVAHLLNRV